MHRLDVALEVVPAVGAIAARGRAAARLAVRTHEALGDRVAVAGGVAERGLRGTAPRTRLDAVLRRRRSDGHVQVQQPVDEERPRGGGLRRRRCGQRRGGCWCN